MRWLIGAGLAIVLLAALSVEAFASRCPGGNLLDRVAPLAQGLYSAEYSTTFPGPKGATARFYRWTQPSSLVPIWPSLMGTGTVSLEYLAPQPQGKVFLSVNSSATMTLSAAPTIRTVYLLLPARGNQSVGLLQTSPSVVENRALGLIIGELRCWSFGGQGLAVQPNALPGLPLTLLLLMLLTWMLRLSSGWIAGLPVLALIVTAGLAALFPWESRAVQPAFQTLLAAALGGVALWLWTRARRMRGIGALLVGVWALSTLLFFTPVIQHDGTGYYAYVRSLFVDGDLRFANELDPLRSPFRTTDLSYSTTATGYTPNPWSVGPALLWTPFWLLAHLLTGVGRLLGLGWVADGYALPYVVLVTLASALAGLATLVGMFVLARRWFAAPVAVIATITIYLGSNLLYYALFDGSFAHSLSGAASTWFVVAAFRLEDTPDWRHWLTLGVLGGVMLLVYWLSAFLLLIPAAIFVRLLLRWGPARMLPGAVLAAATALLTFSPQMLIWRLLFGGLLAIPQGQSYITPGDVHLGSVLVGSLHGLAWWTPAFFAGLLGSIWFALRRPWPGMLLLAILALYTLYNASLADWHGSGAFGMRRLTVATPIFVLGLATILNRLWRHPRWACAFAGALCGWGVQMTVRYVAYSIPHDVDVLGDLSLGSLLLSPLSVPLRSFVHAVAGSWAGQLVRDPGAGALLISLVSLSLVILILLLARRYWPTRVVIA